MAMTIGVNKKTGTFSYEVYNGNQMIDAGSNYPTMQDAEQSAKVVYHALHRANFIWPHAFIQNDYMSLDDVMGELGL